MRIHFQEQPWDIYVLIGYTVVMGGMLLGLGAPNILAVALDLLVPGYVLVAALFPRNKEIDWIERIALTFGLSLASVPLLGLALSLTPLGIRSIPVAALLVAFSIVVGAVAYWRRVRLPVAERLSGTVQLTLPGLKGDSLLEKVLTIAIAAIVFMAAGTLAYLIATPRSGERFTEF